MMRTLLLVIVCAALLISILLLAGCDTRDEMNTGAPVVLTYTSYSILQNDVRAIGLHETVDGITITENGVTTIDVWNLAPPWVVKHEFCHLIDHCRGNPSLALSMLIPPEGVSPKFAHIFGELKAFVSRIRPLGSIPHWRQLANEYDYLADDVVQHAVLTRLLTAEGPNPIRMPPPIGLSTMSLDD